MIQCPRFIEHVLGGRNAGVICELAEDWSISLLFVRFTIRAGFMTDGASVPVLLRRWAGHPFDFPRIAAALVHDWLYASHALPRWLSDLVFLILLIHVGYPVCRSIADWWAVVHFGGSAWRSHGPTDQTMTRPLGSLSICFKHQKEINE